MKSGSKSRRSKLPTVLLALRNSRRLLKRLSSRVITKRGSTFSAKNTWLRVSLAMMTSNALSKSTASLARIKNSVPSSPTSGVSFMVEQISTQWTNFLSKTSWHKVRSSQRTWIAPILISAINWNESATHLKSKTELLTSCLVGRHMRRLSALISVLSSCHSKSSGSTRVWLIWSKSWRIESMIREALLFCGLALPWLVCYLSLTYMIKSSFLIRRFPQSLGEVKLSRRKKVKTSVRLVNLSHLKSSTCLVVAWSCATIASKRIKIQFVRNVGSRFTAMMLYAFAKSMSDGNLLFVSTGVDKS